MNQQILQSWWCHPPLPYSTKLGGPETLEVQVFKACTDFEVAPGINASLETTFCGPDLLLEFLCFDGFFVEKWPNKIKQTEIIGGRYSRILQCQISGVQHI